MNSPLQMPVPIELTAEETVEILAVLSGRVKEMEARNSNYYKDCAKIIKRSIKKIEKAQKDAIIQRNKKEFTEFYEVK